MHYYVQVWLSLPNMDNFESLRNSDLTDYICVTVLLLKYFSGNTNYSTPTQNIISNNHVDLPACRTHLSLSEIFYTHPKVGYDCVPRLTWETNGKDVTSIRNILQFLIFFSSSSMLAASSVSRSSGGMGTLAWALAWALKWAFGWLTQFGN